MRTGAASRRARAQLNFGLRGVTFARDTAGEESNTGVFRQHSGLVAFLLIQERGEVVFNVT